MTIKISNTHGENPKNPNKINQKSKDNRFTIVSQNKADSKTNKTNRFVYDKPKIVPPPAKPVSFVNKFINTLFRLSIIGVGIGTIFGTFLANRDLTKPLFPKVNLPFMAKIFPESQTSENKTVADSTADKKEETNKSTNLVNNLVTEINFSKEESGLKQKLNELTAKYPQLEASIFFVDLDNGVYVNANGIKPLPAASTIKIPVLIAFLQDVDEGKIYLDEELTMTEANRVSGSGGIQYKGVGKKYSAIDVATQMIINSDNAATEMIIERLGGKDQLNERFWEWGLESTMIKNLLPDLEGTNTTSARDLALLLAKVNQGQLISLRSRDRLMDIMTRTKTRTLLPQGIEDGAMIAHKTGDIGKALADAGIIDMPTGKRYVGAVIVTRPHNDPAARTLIQDISGTTYQHFKWYLPRSSNY